MLGAATWWWVLHRGVCCNVCWVLQRRAGCCAEVGAARRAATLSAAWNLLFFCVLPNVIRTQHMCEEVKGWAQSSVAPAVAAYKPAEQLALLGCHPSWLPACRPLLAVLRSVNDLARIVTTEGKKLGLNVEVGRSGRPGAAARRLDHCNPVQASISLYKQHGGHRLARV